MNSLQFILNIKLAIQDLNSFWKLNYHSSKTSTNLNNLNWTRLSGDWTLIKPDLTISEHNFTASMFDNIYILNMSR